MSFQTQIRFDLGFGVPGELRKDGPTRSIHAYLNTTNPALNVVGSFFTRKPDGTAQAGGDMTVAGTSFLGILANPKVYSTFGTAVAGPLAPSLVLPNNLTAEFLQMGYPVLVASNAGVLIGDDVHYVILTGALLTARAGTAPAAGNAKVPGATVDELPQAVATSLFLAKLTN